MATFTRDAIKSILNDTKLTPGEKEDKIFALHGQHLAEGYVTKAEAKTAADAALAAVQPPDPKQTQEYLDLQAQFDAFKSKEDARRSEDFRGVKDKFFDAVYSAIDRSKDAKPVAEQIEQMRTDYAEYFSDDDAPQQGGNPSFGAQSKGNMPQGNANGSFAAAWGYGASRGNTDKK